MQKSTKIINGFGYVKGEVIYFIDLYTEKLFLYKIEVFKKFMDENAVDECCIFLSNRENGEVTPLYKYKLINFKTKLPVQASTKTHDELIDMCYRVCIEMFKVGVEPISSEQ